MKGKQRKYGQVNGKCMPFQRRRCNDDRQTKKTPWHWTEAYNEPPNRWWHWVFGTVFFAVVMWILSEWM